MARRRDSADESILLWPGRHSRICTDSGISGPGWQRRWQGRL